MERLSKLFSFISPAAKRRQTITPVVADNQEQTPQHTAGYSPPSVPQDRKAREKAQERVNKKYLSPSDTKKQSQNPLKRDHDVYGQDVGGPKDIRSRKRVVSERKYTEADLTSGDEYNDDKESVDPPDTDDDYRDEHTDDDEFEDDQLVLSAEEKSTEYLDRQAELAKRMEEIQAVRNGERGGKWHVDEEFLFERLAMRSYEPLLPVDWRIDFPTFPEDLFAKDVRGALINYNFASSYRGR